MTRWQLENGSANYWTRYHAYENYLRDYAKRAGLSETQVSEQLGRYAVGLQDKLQIEPDKLAFGKEVAKNPEYWGTSNTSTAQTLQNTGQQLKTETRNFAGGTVTSYYGGTLEQLRNAEPLGNRAQAAIEKSDFQKALEKTQFFRTTNGNSVDRLGKAKQNRIAAELRSLIQSAKTPEEQAIIKDRVAKFRGGNDQKLFNSIISENLNSAQTQVSGVVKADRTAEERIKFNKLYGKHEPRTWAKYNTEHGLPAQQKQVSGVVKADQKAEERIKFNKLYGKHKPRTWAKYNAEHGLPVQEKQVSGVVKADQKAEEIIKSASENKKATGGVKLGAAKGAKTQTGFLGKMGKFFKGKKGKLAIAAAVTAGTIWLGSKLLNKNSKVQEQTTEDTSQAATPTLPAEPVTQPENSSSGGTSEYNYTVKNGDCFWNIAKENLIQKHGGNYTPSNQEILKETLKITETNNYTLDQDGWYSNPMLYPDAQLQIAA